MKRAVSFSILLTSVAVLAFSAMAQQQENQKPANNALAVLLESKGILSAGELATIDQASTPEEANARLAQLLVEKGLISQQELNNTVTPVSEDAATVHLSNAVLQTQNPPQAGQTPTGTPPTPERGPGIIPAVAPVRVLRVHPRE